MTTVRWSPLRGGVLRALIARLGSTTLSGTTWDGRSRQNREGLTHCANPGAIVETDSVRCIGIFETRWVFGKPRTLGQTPSPTTPTWGEGAPTLTLPQSTGEGTRRGEGRGENQIDDILLLRDWHESVKPPRFRRDPLVRESCILGATTVVSTLAELPSGKSVRILSRAAATPFRYTAESRLQSAKDVTLVA